MQWELYDTNGVVANTIVANDEKFVEQYAIANDWTYGKVMPIFESEIDSITELEILAINHEYRLTLLELGV